MDSNELIGPVTRAAYKNVPSLTRAVNEAREWLEGSPRPMKRGFEDVDDDSL